MSNSLNLELPYLEEAQAQKHVTVNDALTRLDSLVQLTVIDRDLAAPPGAPAEGDRYIVAASATGAWAGHEADVAAFVDGAWAFFAPREGWLAYVQDEDGLTVFDGAGWDALGGALAAHSTSKLGINTSASDTNKLAVSSSYALFSPAVGAGDVRIVATKDAAGDVVSHLFQTNYSGRAEFGLIGSDDFSLKVSADGSAFSQAFAVDRTTATVSFDNAIDADGAGVTLGADGVSWASGLSISLGAAGEAGSVAVGASALVAATTGTDNSALGASALGAVTTGSENVAIGGNAGGALTIASGATFVGFGAGAALTGADNSALGRDAFVGAPAAVTNCAAVGAAATVTGSNQVQLGDSATTTYAYGAVQNRSDARDKTDVRDTALGLAFVRALRPVDFRWDYREDYRGPAGTVRDGSKTRSRYHHGFIAQDVEALIGATGVDFGGFQDHAIGGGRDVKSLGYTEFVAPLVKAVQELSAEVDALRARLEAAPTG
ncbi:DUF2793 domain-containing protein [Acuticoccus sp. I52.16.1]|uniref:DUF2793 domain-containing protein n=1 Tax=Acuticoccus sp. I52.16.1 TaxID=2928472 RepID=UPI001FD19E0A|nr:DUF2793 domain-containing protein [Acuticoccus sp. I52.16.1]UOM33839.1 DUF2793 domain-containing protein [Acuticoccus sp. I52.16.1]